jgi:hypothetical protein
MSCTIIETCDSLTMPEPNTGCLLWLGGATGDGYPSTSLDGKPMGAHRAAYATFVGPLTKNAVVRHKCNTPMCVNPAHLLAGSHLDNVADAVALARHPHGDSHGRRRLSSADVRDIRDRHDGGEARSSIARDYGIKPETVRKIVKREIWALNP